MCSVVHYFGFLFVMQETPCHKQHVLKKGIVFNCGVTVIRF
jgi:hypothetical protein